MTDVLERLERLERLLGVRAGAEEVGQKKGKRRRARVSGSTDDAADGAPVALQRSQAGHQAFNDWMKAEHRPGRIVVAVGVKSDRSSWNSSMRRDAGQKVKRGELVATAALCQALSSETRLAIINELVVGDRTTSELMEAVAIDRGQLYHHLRDLFVQGLVGQPERGRYAVTTRGFMAFLVAGALTHAGDPVERARVVDLSGLEEEERSGEE